MKRFAAYRLSKACAVFIVASLLGAGTVAADTGDLRWHGFFSQGLIQTDHNNFFGESSETSTDFRDLGLGFAWKPQANLLVSAQAIYRDAGETSPEGVNLDYAMINYSLVNRLEFGAGLRVGRVKNPYGFYNETRDVAATRPSVLLPQSIYPDALRELFHTSDSLTLYGYREVGDLLFDFNVLGGKANIDENAEDFLVPGPQPGKIDGDSLWGGRGIVEYDGGRIRLGFMYVDFAGDIETAPVAPPFGILPGRIEMRTRALMFEYNWLRWQFTSEYMRIATQFTDVFGHGVRTSREAEAYYLQLAYQLDPQWRLFTRYDVYYPDREDKSGEDLQAAGGLKSNGFAKDFTFGVQYLINEAWMLAAEIHHVKGTAWLVPSENPDPAEIEEDWNLFTMQLSYKF